MIFSRFPPTPTYTLPVPRGSCNERQRTDRQIREPDIAGSETMTFYRLSKIHSAVPSYLLVLLRHPPVPPVPASGSEPVATRPRYLPFRRNGKEAVHVGTDADGGGRSSRIALYSLHTQSTLVLRRGVITGESQQTPRIRGRNEKLVFMKRGDPRVQHRVPLNASDL